MADTATIAKYGAIQYNVNKGKTVLDNGVYKCILGGFNMATEGGVYYFFTQRVKSIFDKSSILMRRIRKGYLKGEYGHPNINGLGTDAAKMRVIRIEPDNVSHFIKEVELKEVKDDQGNAFIVVVGLIKPTGPKGDYLQKSFDDEDENVAFSARSFQVPIYVNGKAGSEIRSIITWDYVIEPNIAKANSYDTSLLLDDIDYKLRCMEDRYSSMSFTERDIIKLTEDLEKGIVKDIQMDNAFIQTVRMIKTDLGWTSVNVIEGPSILNLLDM